MKADVVIIGEGVIGLSAAWQLSRSGVSVTLVDRGPGRGESSPAAAGLLPAAPREAHARDPLERMAAVGRRLHGEWYPQLVEASGIDYGFSVDGAVYLGLSRSERALLAGQLRMWRDQQLEPAVLDHAALARLLPAVALRLRGRDDWTAVYCADDAHLNTNAFLEALREAVRRRGVRSVRGEVQRLVGSGGRVTRVETAAGEWIAGEAFCVCGGAWSGELLRTAGIEIEVVPVRGQIIEYDFGQRPFAATVYCGDLYLMPRRDGTLIAGATVEHAGFDSRITTEATELLRRFAESQIPELCGREPDRVRVGLRPGSGDAFPYLGRAPQWDNLFVAAGHFRGGILLAPATAEILEQLLQGESLPADGEFFRVGRGAADHERIAVEAAG